MDLEATKSFSFVFNLILFMVEIVYLTFATKSKKSMKIMND